MAVNYIANSKTECVVDSGISRAEWDAMSEEERQEVLAEFAEGEIENHVETWAEVEE
jgi:hypothetical protein